jgi:hypothetical protein
VPSLFNRSPAARAALSARIAVLDSKGGGFMARIVLTITTLALATFGFESRVHAQTCPAGSHVATQTFSNLLGPLAPPWTGITLTLPKFDAAAGQTLIQADIVPHVHFNGSVQAENVSSGGCTFSWSTSIETEIDLPAPVTPPVFPISNSGSSNLDHFDGTIDFRGPSGTTQLLAADPQTLVSITDAGDLATYFTGAGTAVFTTNCTNSSTGSGCSPLVSIFDANVQVVITITYYYCTPSTAMCAPGAHGVLACPCGNPQLPAGAVKGCNNSSATGGAVLTAGGLALLSADTVVFTTSGEKPTATSVVLQGDALIGSGTTFGQGVRCAGGTLVRLYTKTAASGSIVAPSAGDPTVSARSAALGDTIVAGQTRWYLVYYRDPNVLGGCPVSSTFNATQGQAIAWQL